MSLAVRLKYKKKPKGYEKLEPHLLECERKMRDAVDAPHHGKSKNEANWPIHRLHYEKNRLVYELHHKQKSLSKELFDFLVREKIVDAPLIAQWNKQGYETLCSMAAIQRSNTNYGTTSICRVPLTRRGGQVLPSVLTGCISCVSGEGIDGRPIWWDDPYTAWASRIGGGGGGKKQKRGSGGGATDALDADVEERLKKLRGDAEAPLEEPSGGGSGGDGGGASVGGAGGEVEGIGSEVGQCPSAPLVAPEVEDRLRRLRGES